MIKILNILIFCFFSLRLNANPDVIFKDSDKYNNAYLKHKLGRSEQRVKIKFKLSAPILGFKIPEEFYDKKTLLLYINIHKFPTANLKKEFEDMFSMTINSEHTAEEFLTELLKILDSYTKELNEGKNAGCSSLNGQCLLLIFAPLTLFYSQRRSKMLPPKSD